MITKESWDAYMDKLEAEVNKPKMYAIFVQPEPEKSKLNKMAQNAVDKQRKNWGIKPVGRWSK